MEQKPPRNEDDAQIIPFTVRCEELADGEKDVANAQIMRSLLSKYKSEIEQLSDYQKKDVYG